MAEHITSQIDEVLISPLEQIIARIGQGMADAQRALDLNSIATQTQIENDPALREFGLEATWYHMPETEVELKLALNFRREDKVKNNKFISRKFRMYGAPLNAAYQNAFKANVSGSSQIKFKIVSIPPTRRTT
jgi:hypothetical protein